MAKYEEGRIGRLAEALRRERVDEETRERILVGGSEIGAKSKPEAKAEWFAGAMRRLDEELDLGTMRAVRERCACCLGGKRHELAKAIAAEHETLEERIAAANNTPFVFGHSVSRTPKGDVLVSFFPEGLERYDCPCLRGVTTPLPVSYCYCCAGHVKRHLGTALGCKVEVKVRSSALSSGGRKPCQFVCKLLDA